MCSLQRSLNRLQDPLPFQLSAKFTTEVVSNCIYGIDSNSFANEKSVLLTMGTSVLDSSGSMMVYLVLTTFFPIIKRFWKKAFIPKKTENFFMKLTMDAVRMRDEANNQREDFMNYVLNLRNKKNLSDIDIAAHAITFFLDGFETSSVALCFTMYYLGKNKQIQDKLRKEIMKNVGDDGRLSFDKITEMPYLEQVLNGKCITKLVHYGQQSLRKYSNDFDLCRGSTNSSSTRIYYQNMQEQNSPNRLQRQKTNR